jgi:hypothetical protein
MVILYLRFTSVYGGASIASEAAATAFPLLVFTSNPPKAVLVQEKPHFVALPCAE